MEIIWESEDKHDRIVFYEDEGPECPPHLLKVFGPYAKGYYREMDYDNSKWSRWYVGPPNERCKTEEELLLPEHKEVIRLHHQGRLQ